MSNAKVDAILEGINKNAKRKIVRYGCDVPEPSYLLTFNPLLDLVLLGGHGLQQGMIAMMYGWPSVGKSMGNKAWMASIQRQVPDKPSAVIAAEPGDYTPARLREVGVDPDRVIVIDGFTAEQATTALLDLIYDKSTRSPRNILASWHIDSIPAMIPEEEFEKDIDEEARLGALARPMARFMPQAANLSGTAVGVMVNQLRTSIGGPEKPHTPCGIAPMYYSKLALRVSTVGLGSADNNVGKTFGEKQRTRMPIVVELDKNNTRMGRQNGAQITYYAHLVEHPTFGLGVSDLECLLRAGLILGYIMRKGSTSYYFDIGNGQENYVGSFDSFASMFKERDLTEAMRTEFYRRAQSESVIRPLNLAAALIEEEGDMEDLKDLDRAVRPDPETLV